jgi:hypothetical protein
MCVRKTPLAEVFHFFPGNGARKGFDVWRVVGDYYGQAVGKLQAESMMSTTASLFPQIRRRADSTTEGDA